MASGPISWNPPLPRHALPKPAQAPQPTGICTGMRCSAGSPRSRSAGVRCSTATNDQVLIHKQAHGFTDRADVHTSKLGHVDGVWQLIASFLLHNIRVHGKHLKPDANVHRYNKIMRAIPKPVPFNVGPKILFTSGGIVKFAYRSPFLKTHYHRTILEYQIWDLDKEAKRYLEEYKSQY